MLRKQILKPEVHYNQNKEPESEVASLTHLMPLFPMSEEFRGFAWTTDACPVAEMGEMGTESRGRKEGQRLGQRSRDTG